MPLTTVDWLTVLEPKLTGPLFESETVERLRRLAQALPGECQGTLEVRLAPKATPVDLSLRLLTAPQALAVAARLPTSPIGDFLSRWSDPGGSLAPVRSVWLEFDVDRMGVGETLTPVVCAKLPPDIDRGWLLGTLLPALHGDPLTAGQRARILASLGVLPDSARLLYVFSLKARGSDAVRLEIFGLSSSQILGYLRSVAPQTVPAVAEITPLFEGVERLHVSFDISEGILPRIGIEGSFPRQPGREPRWQELFSRLESRGLCSHEKRETILAWPGYDTFWTAPERWPISEVGARGFCIRALSHVKTICHQDRGPEAKAYLIFGPLDGSSDGAPANSPAMRSTFSA